MTAALASPHHKASGAYYTGAGVASFLCRWAIRGAGDRVLDPSFGGGVFLDAAAERIAHLGGDARLGVHGGELDPGTHAAVLARAGSVFAPERMQLGSFFDREACGGFDAVVGNPPFVRYQSFTGSARAAARGRAREAGVELDGLCSSWAAFTVHGAACLAPGGRLGFVLPMELFHAAYALPVLRFLVKGFDRLDVLTFRRRLFPELSQDTVLLLAEGRHAGGQPDHAAEMRHSDLAGAEALDRIHHPDQTPGQPLPAADVAAGRRRLVSFLMPTVAQAAYARFVGKADDPEAEASGAPGARRLGTLASAGIGYVSGNNAYFHLSRAEAHERGLPTERLLPIVRKGRALRGLRFRVQDWEAADGEGDAGYLFHAPGGLAGADFDAATRDYLRHGEGLGVPRAYKCRVRDPWHAVPVSDPPDAFLTYMSGGTPRLAANAAGALAPNNLHLVRLKPAAAAAGWTADLLAAAWRCSLTALSVEIEGHSLGGGMLKLEPREAARVLVAGPPLTRLDLASLDTTARTQPAAATRLIDEATLAPDVASALAEGAEALRSRRTQAGAAAA